MTRALPDTPTPVAAAVAVLLPAYPDVVEWVGGWLVPVVRRIPSPREERRAAHPVRWCPSWWDHAEAVDRLEACWRAWEAARLPTAGPDALARWWVQVFDPAWSALTRPEGTFEHCGPDRHRPLPPLPLRPPPPGWTGP